MTVNDKIAGFIAIGMLPHPKQPYRKVHRLVILPDYQGIGLGKILLNFIGTIINDYPFAITTSNPALINSLKIDDNWICTRNTRNTGKLAKGLNKTLSNKRIVTTFIFKNKVKKVKYG
jgi:GNAT superfamily N-acetyltransferase